MPASQPGQKTNVLLSKTNTFHQKPLKTLSKTKINQRKTKKTLPGTKNNNYSASGHPHPGDYRTRVLGGP